MSRNGSGVYSLPITYQAVSGETIEAQQHNDPLEDLQTDANTARPIVAGGTGSTTAAAARTALGVPGLSGDNTFAGNQTFSGTITSSGINTFSKIQKWAKGADVASANALTLGDDGNYFDITGTTAITSIATKGVGTVVRLHFDGALTLTYNATTLILPGAANITTAAGDEAEFIEYATGDWRCLSYQKAAHLFVTTADLATVAVSGSYADLTNKPSTAKYESSQVSLSTINGSSFTHGLGAVPTLAQVRAICTTAEFGYSVGDIKIINPSTELSGAANSGISLTVSSTIVHIGVASTGINAINKSTGALVLLTPSSWSLQIVAVLLG